MRGLPYRKHRMVASNYVPLRLGLCWSRAPGLLPAGQRSFAINGPLTWNSLPADLRTPDTTLCSFKRHQTAVIRLCLFTERVL